MFHLTENRGVKRQLHKWRLKIREFASVVSRLHDADSLYIPWVSSTRHSQMLKFLPSEDVAVEVS